MTEKQIIQSLEIYAHKIRNPLHSTIINLDVLKTKLEKEIKDKRILQLLEIANKEVQRLNTITAKYLDYLKMPEKNQLKIDLKKYLS